MCTSIFCFSCFSALTPFGIHSGQEMDATATLPHIINFNDDELHKTCFASFEHMRRKGKLCDITLISESKRFAAHKIVLAATIPFFNGMFLSNMSESNKNEISILGVDAIALEAFVGFAYIGSIQITPSNVQSLLIGASFLQVNSIRNICCKYIEERLSPSTVLAARSFARSLMCNHLALACDNYLFDHFGSVSQNEAFLRIDGNDLLTLLESDELSVANEERLFELVIAWVEYEEKPHKSEPLMLEQAPLSADKQGATSVSITDDPPCLDSRGASPVGHLSCSPCRPSWFSEPSLSLLRSTFGLHSTAKPSQSRVDLLPELLKRIRLPLISANYISSVISKHRLIRENIQCRDLLDEVRDMLLLRDRVSSSFCCRPRRGQEVFGIIYAVGGLTSNGDCHGIVETYHPSIGRWELAEHMPSQRSRIGVIALNGLLYAIGGFDGTSRLNTTEVYDPRTKVWRTVAPMNYKRSALGAAALDGRIYVCGGYDGVASLRTCEVYYPQQNKWLIVSSMNEPRSAGGLVALNNGCLYAVGGHNGLAIYSSVECYHPRAVGPAAAAMQLTSGDGVNSSNVTGPTSHRSSATSTPWQPVARMLYRRCRHGVTVLHNRIIVAGGYNGVTFLRNVEVFDPSAGPDANGIMGQWTEIASLEVPRSRVGLAVTGGRLYAIGGYDGITHLRTVECFHPPSSDADNYVLGASDTVSLPDTTRRRRSTPAQTTNQNASSTTSHPLTSSSYSTSTDEDDDDVSSPSNQSTSESASTSQSQSHQPTNQSRSASKQGTAPPDSRLHGSAGAFANWVWTPAASLIAHEGWVGVGVLPLDDASPALLMPSKPPDAPLFNAAACSPPSRPCSSVESGFWSWTQPM
ncbi:unnamed protein product [Dicrocoelium dendriticum]|nr:unnamed protein product [Dicrocoelium dendriticum]